MFTVMRASGTRGRVWVGIFSFTTGRDSMSLWDTGHRMRCISAKAETTMDRRMN